MRNKLGRFIKGHARSNTGRTHFHKGQPAPEKCFKKGHTKPKGAYSFGNGKDNPRWNNGKTIDKDGYILISKPKHPFSNQCGYVRKHRLVVEKHLGRILEPSEAVHHINGNVKDNNLKNLMVFRNHGFHMSYHHHNKCNPNGIIFNGSSHPAAGS